SVRTAYGGQPVEIRRNALILQRVARNQANQTASGGAMNREEKHTDVLPTGSAQPDAVGDPGPADPAPDLIDLLKTAESEAAEMKDAWLRARADIENIRKQGANDVARAHKYAIERFAGELLPVKDALESTLAAKEAAPQALRDGVELTLKQLAAAFEKAQIT